METGAALYRWVLNCPSLKLVMFFADKKVLLQFMYQMFGGFVVVVVVVLLFFCLSFAFCFCCFWLGFLFYLFIYYFIVIYLFLILFIYLFIILCGGEVLGLCKSSCITGTHSHIVSH